MDDIERRVLVQDVRREKDRDDFKRGYDSGDSDDDLSLIVPEPPGQGANDIPYNPNRHNTGPKGVKADYEEAKFRAKLARERKEMERKIIEGAIAAGAVEDRYESAIFAADLIDHPSDGRSSSTVRTEPAFAQSSSARDGKGERGEKDSDDEFADLDSDEESFNAYRAQRLQQALGDRPRFGRVVELTKAEYVAAIDSEASNVFVVVHLYEQFVKACKRLNNILDFLAQKYPLVKFCRIESRLAKADYDHVALPTLIVYNDKDVVDVSVRLPDIFGKWFTVEDIEAHLARLGALVIPRS
eukprot:GILK01003222.1.p1 GENE.GILK01003222.1~~GILK01003222.1.p1  ORF type:complete len:341 (-),score=69.99 GILK01003222.1:221-1117(-)